MDESELRDNRTSRRDLVRRAILLTITGVALYLMAPGLIELFSSWPHLREIGVGWIVLMVLAEVASFVCWWLVQKVALNARQWLPIITSQLAGNAFGRVVPGGGAAAGAFQFRMLKEAGFAGPSIVTGLSAVHMLTFSTLVALPILTIPALLNATEVDDGLMRGVWIGVAALVVLFVLGTILLTTDHPLRVLGRLIERVRNRIFRGREPMRGFGQKLIEERDQIKTVIGERWWEALLGSIGRWLFDFGALIAALLALGVDAAPSLVLLAYVSANLLGMLGITPGGIGIVEAGMTGTLVLARVGAADALVATLAYRLVSFWLPLPLGAAAVPLHKRLVVNRRPPSSAGSTA